MDSMDNDDQQPEFPAGDLPQPEHAYREPVRPVAPPWWADEPSAAAVADRPSRRHGVLRVGAAGAAVIVAAATSGVVVHSLDGDRTTASNTTLVPAATAAASVTTALAKAEKSVVIINDTITSTSSSSGGFGGGFGGGSTTSSAAGTGIVITAGGEVVTNAHVVNGATDIKVTLPNGSVHSATIVGLNATKDLAVIKLSGVSGLTPATFADSDTASVGDSVIAIGNAEGYGGSPTVTAGILSAKGRSLTSSTDTSSEENLTGLLQTDAAINPGNSGGPLIDSAGDVIGIDTAVATGTTDEPAQNIGFAIPSDEVVSQLSSLESGTMTGAASSSGSGSTSGAVLGVVVADGSGSGATVEQVESGSGAAAAGLQAGDVITGFGSTQITSASALGQAVEADQPGQRVKITYTRNGTSATTTATLGS
jgi:serine protease Do